MTPWILGLRAVGARGKPAKPLGREGGPLGHASWGIFFAFVSRARGETDGA